MKLRFTRRATEDLAGIGNYIAEQNPAAAARVCAAILESLRLLVDYPHIGRAQTVEGVRKIVTRRYPYIIYSALTPMRRKWWSLLCNTRRARENTQTNSQSC